MPAPKDNQNALKPSGLPDPLEFKITFSREDTQKIFVAFEHDKKRAHKDLAELRDWLRDAAKRGAMSQVGT